MKKENNLVPVSYKIASSILYSYYIVFMLQLYQLWVLKYSLSVIKNIQYERAKQSRNLISFKRNTIFCTVVQAGCFCIEIINCEYLYISDKMTKLIKFDKSSLYLPQGPTHHTFREGDICICFRGTLCIWVGGLGVI